MLGTERSREDYKYRKCINYGKSLTERLVYLVKQLLLELLVLNQLPDARQAFGDLIRWQSAH